MPVNGCMSAAEVLAGNLAPGSFSPLCKSASVWGAPKARSASAAMAFKPANSQSKGVAQPNSLDSSETVATAAGALLGLQSENTRMSHKQVEQHRRLKAKQYFDELRCLVPGGTDSKNDRNRVLHLAIDHLKALLSGTTTPQTEVTTDADEAAQLSGEDTGDQLMFEMDGVESKKLSHNEVEQRRRLQAKMLYEELRALLPNAAKFDKNTVLLSCIHLLKQKQGITEAALQEMVQGLNQAEGDGKDAVAKAGRGVKTDSGIATSVKNLGLTNGLWGGNSESPSDVVSFADSMFPTSSQQQKRSNRKRAAPSEHSHGEVPTQPDSSNSASSIKAEEADDNMGRKRSRASSPELATTPGDGRTTSSSHGAPSSSLPPLPSEDEGAGGEAEGNGGQQPAVLDALSLLSACATQVSEPGTPFGTPQMAPSSWGTSSLIKALHPLSLSSTPS